MSFLAIIPPRVGFFVRESNKVVQPDLKALAYLSRFVVVDMQGLFCWLFVIYTKRRYMTISLELLEKHSVQVAKSECLWR